MERVKTPSKIAGLLRYGVIAILVLLPFHALFTTWLGSNFGHLDLFRIWKELLIALMVPAALWLVYKDRQLREWFRSSRLVLLVLLYVLLHVLLGAWALAEDRVNPEALIFALLVNLRFPVFMLLVLVVAAKTDLTNHWKRLLLWPAAVVTIFGLLQLFVLPADFLRHFGYGPDTIPAVQTVDEKPEYQRIQSTLRGANPLGAYMVLVVTALAGLMLPVNSSKPSQNHVRGSTSHISGKTPAVLQRLPLCVRSDLTHRVLLGMGLAVLFFTYSRSAWLGTLASLAALGFLVIKSARVRRLAVLAIVTFAVAFSGTVWLLRDNDRVQNTLFHSDENSLSSESSNAARGRHLSEGVRSVIEEPLGRGPGTAGPASVRNDQPPRLAENYFIQIAQEVGVLGLALFIAINAYVAHKLWQQRRDTLSLILLASLIGITFINLLSHAWTDDTLSLLWWSLAALAPASFAQKPHVLQ
jgi:hypothetical protein